MPFGSMFGALYFGFLCGWIGLELLGEPFAASRVAGASLALMGLSLAVGLLQRRPWARWLGLAAALIMTLFALRSVAAEGSVSDNLLLFSSVVAAVLLALPATGRARPSTVATDRARRGAGALKLTTVLGMLGLVASVWWTSLEATSRTGSSLDLPASAVARSLRWLDFDEGLRVAGQEGRPLLVTFVTDWCPYCAKMERQTWHSASVIERVSDLVTVKVDAEESVRRGGLSGRELASRYGVEGFPANFLLDAEGQVIARADGYLGPGQLLSWIDRSVGPPRGGGNALTQRTSR